MSAGAEGVRAALNSGQVTKKAALGTRLFELVSIVRSCCLSKAGLAIGSGSKAKVLIANTTAFQYLGVLYSKTTAEVAFTATTHDIAPHATLVQEAVYLYSLQTDGDVTVTMGTIASGSGTAQIPKTPSGEVAIGYLRLAVAAGATLFDATTDELDEAHLTDTYVDLMYNIGDFANTAPAAL